MEWLIQLINNIRTQLIEWWRTLTDHCSCDGLNRENKLKE